MTRSRYPLLASMFLAIALAVPLRAATDTTGATDEYALKDFFEGMRVVVRLDMPGTHEGVNLYPDARRDFDVSEYRRHLREYGVALQAGETAMVTLVKVKKDLIEFQLDGGGYGTFWDDTDTSVHVSYLARSDRERALERLIRNEPDRRRRSRLQRELNDLRDWRESENRRRQFEAARLAERKALRVEGRRLDGGSRFNLRFRDRVPSNFGPEDIMDALAEYVEFRDVRSWRGRQP